MTAVEQENKVKIEGNSIIVENFQTEDYDIVSYFENLNESDDLGQKLENALKIGIVAMRAIGVDSNVKYVEKAFANLDSNLKQKLDSAFAEDGKFSSVVEKHFGEDGKIIKDIFDPNREGTPLYQLRSELEKYLSEIRDKIGINEATKSIVAKSTQKGLDFEDRCKKKLEWIARTHSDKLERTGNTAGKLSRSKKGDFVLTLENIGKKMVFEIKDQNPIGLPYIQKELKEAMENRGAEYGIFVAKNVDSMPGHVGFFNEFDGNQLACAVEAGDGDSLIDDEMIHIAYKWARAKLRIESNKDKKLDPAFILEKSHMVQKKISDMRKIKADCTSIEKSTKSIRDTAIDTESEIKKELDEIIKSLEMDGNFHVDKS